MSTKYNTVVIYILCKTSKNIKRARFVFNFAKLNFLIILKTIPSLQYD